MGSVTQLVTIGADIGQKRDPTAIAVCTAALRSVVLPPLPTPPPSGPMRYLEGRDVARYVALQEARANPRTVNETTFTVRSLKKLPIGTSYPDVADIIAATVRSVAELPLGQGERGRRVWVIVDATGVGGPVVDLVRRALKGTGYPVTAATFVHGERLTGRLGDAEWRVGKAYLVSRLQALFQGRALEIPKDHALASAMMTELMDFEIKIDEHAVDTYGAFKTGAHDDLVTALGLSVLGDPWHAVNRNQAWGFS